MTPASLPGESARCSSDKSRYAQKFLTIRATLELETAAIAQAGNSTHRNARSRPALVNGKLPPFAPLGEIRARLKIVLLV
jgi:hypothetical protein